MGVFISCTFTIKFIRSDLMAIFFSLLFDPTQVHPPALSKTVERSGPSPVLVRGAFLRLSTQLLRRQARGKQLRFVLNVKFLNKQFGLLLTRWYLRSEPRRVKFLVRQWNTLAA